MVQDEDKNVDKKNENEHHPHRMRSNLDRVVRSLTGDNGVIAAVIVGLALLGGLIGLVQQSSNLFRSVTDSGPTDEDVAAVPKVLPDGRTHDGPTRYLLPYGQRLPDLHYDPTTGSYCGDLQDDFIKLGPSIGASLTVSLQNTYTGSKPAGIQVSDIRVVVVDQSEPSPGVLMTCTNSAGDTPVVGHVRAVEGATIVSSAPDSSSKWSSWSGSGQTVSFVLDAGEQQQINIDVAPANTDRKVNLVADIVANGQTFEKMLTTTPINVVSDHAASSTFIQLGGNGTTPSYECHPPGQQPGRLCKSNQVFTLKEDKAG